MIFFFILGASVVGVGVSDVANTAAITSHGVQVQAVVLGVGVLDSTRPPTPTRTLPEEPRSLGLVAADGLEGS